MTFAQVYSSLNFYLMMLIAMPIVCLKMKRRDHFALRLAAGTVLPTAVSILWDYFFSNTAAVRNVIPLILGAKFFIVFWLFVGNIALAYKGDIWTYCIVGIMAYCAQHIAYHLYMISVINAKLPLYAQILILIPFTAIVYFAVYRLFVRRMDKSGRIIVDNKAQIVVLVLLLLVAAFISLYGKIFSSNTTGTITVCLFTVICSVLGVIVQIALVSQKKSETELALLKMMVHSARSQYAKSKDNIDIINIKCHDLKHQLSVFRDRVDEEELDRIKSAVDIYDGTFKTGNPALDVILTEKSFYCAAAGTRLTCMLDGKAFEDWRESDIYSFFGNAIDNAIQGVSALDPDKKIISISGERRGSFYNIRIENFFDGKIEFKDGLPLTQKENKNYHGFGMKSMKMIADRYGGEMTVTADGDVFRLNLLLHNK